MREILLPCYEIVIRLSEQSPSGTISSNLRTSPSATSNARFDAAVSAIESLILAHACAGVDVESPAYLEGIETAMEAVANHLDG